MGRAMLFLCIPWLVNALPQVTWVFFSLCLHISSLTMWPPILRFYRLALQHIFWRNKIQPITLDLSKELRSHTGCLSKESNHRLTLIGGSGKKGRVERQDFPYPLLWPRICRRTQKCTWKMKSGCLLKALNSCYFLTFS